MKKIILVACVLLCIMESCITTSNLSKELKWQKKYLFKELVDNDLYLGMTKTDFLKARPQAELNSDMYDFRNIYVEENFSERFRTLITYIDKDGDEPLYEFILVLNPKYDVNEVAQEQFGIPNHMESEWRFSPEETKMPFTVAAWVYNNKIIIAATIKDTEWAEGID